MDNIDYYKYIDRNSIETKIKKYLDDFYNNKICKFLYIYGETGIGKTNFLNNLLNKLDFTIIYCDNIDNKNKLLLDDIENKINKFNVYSMFFKNPKKNIIIFDNIYNYNYGDKLFINSLIKIIKKKYKKNTNNVFSIIFVNNLSEDKKFLELMKISEVIKINTPNKTELLNILKNSCPDLFKYDIKTNNIIKNNILLYLNRKLYKLKNVFFYYNNDLILEKFNNNNYDISNTNNNIKMVTKNFLENYYSLKQDNLIVDSDRTSVGLLIHENIIKLFKNKDQILKFYLPILNNFIFCDFIDRNIFLNQIWQLNDICYIIKIYYTNYLLYKNNLLDHNLNFDNIIFTKILTKYSSEYNNFIFIFTNIQTFNLNKKELFLYFMFLKNNDTLETNEIPKLIYNRFIKFINNYIDYKYNYYRESNDSEIYNITNDFN
jgi:hypothetical protein